MTANHRLRTQGEPMTRAVVLLSPALFLFIIGCQSASTCNDNTCGEGTTCNPETGQCEVASDSEQETNTPSDAECITDTDCGDATKRCDDGECVPKCEGIVCDTEAGEVCDPTTGLCVGGNGCDVDGDCEEGFICEDQSCVGLRYSACTPNEPCAEGLDCRSGTGFSICVAPCESTTECFLTETCIPEGQLALEDFANHCFVNLCSPGGGMYNNHQDVEFMAPCNAMGENDGICFGPYNNGTENFGYCVGTNGGAALGDDCLSTALHGDLLACANGFCDATSQRCLSYCSIDDGVACSESGDHACYPFAATNGGCYPTVDDAPAAGEECVLEEGVMPCQDDYLCGYANGDTTESLTCVEVCDSEAQAGTPTGCLEGQTCYVYDAVNNPRGGICLNL